MEDVIALLTFPFLILCVCLCVCVCVCLCVCVLTCGRVQMDLLVPLGLPVNQEIVVGKVPMVVMDFQEMMARG